MKFNAQSIFEKCAFAALMGILLSAATAFAGTRGGGGGGDPLANEFLEVAEVIYAAQIARAVDLKVPSSLVRQKIDDIEASLETQTPLVTFEGGETILCFGVDKLGCVRDDNRIYMAKLGWKNASREERLEVVTMELVLSVGGTNRYAIGKAVARILTFDRQSGSARLLQEFGNVELEPAFRRLCEFQVVKQAISLNGGSIYPQFDMTDQKDGLENLISYKLDDPDDEFSDKKDVVRKAALFVSLINNTSEPFHYGFNYVAPGVRVTAPPGERTYLYRHYASYDPDADRGCTILSHATYFSEYVNHGQSTQPAGDYSFEYGVPKRKNTEFPKRNSTATEFFAPCTRMALNKALEIVAKDKTFSGLTSDNPGGRYYDLRSALVAKNDSSNSELFVFGIEASNSNRSNRNGRTITVPYLIKIKTEREGSNCRISDIRAN